MNRRIFVCLAALLAFATPALAQEKSIGPWRRKKAASPKARAAFSLACSSGAANVRPFEYLLGIGIYIWTLCMIGAAVIGIAGGYTGQVYTLYLLAMGFGILVSMVIGAAIGSFSKNQMTATSVTVPVMMIFSFLPMISMFNQTIANVARFTYSEQLRLLISGLGHLKVTPEMPAVLAINAALALGLFVFAYRRSGLEQ